MAMLPANLQGLVDFYVQPDLREGFGPLNGQVVRRRIFEDILAAFDVARIVETGTYRGTSTEYFAAFGIPVQSVEVNDRYHAYSRRRLAHLPNVSLHHLDSVAFLEKQLGLGAIRDGLTVFYLDAHWEDVLPLEDELRLICGNVKEHIIMIDDFEVPGDPGYAFDDYGPRKRLAVDYVKSVPGSEEFHVFFPKAPSSEETGYKRGTAIITANPAIARKLESFAALRAYDLALEAYAALRNTGAR